MIASGHHVGKYRKLLIPFSALNDEAASLAHTLRRLDELRQQDRLSDAEFAAWFILLFAAARVPKKTKRFAQLLDLFGKDAAPRETEFGNAVKDLQIAGMPGMILVILSEWLSGRADLRLSNATVTAQQMLAAQAGGWRYVTVDIEAALAGRPVGGTRDAFEFVLHDLSHAYTFFQPYYDPQGQADFFAKLNHDVPALSPLAEVDTKFAADLEYCMADMNSHPEHLRQYLRGVIVEMFLRQRAADQADAYGEARLAGLLPQLSCLAE